MRKKSTASLPPIGEVLLEEKLHSGSAFDVWGVRHGERRLCVKTPSTSSGGGFVSGASGIDTSLWGGSTSEIKEIEDIDGGAFLALEAEQIRSTQGAWNHDVLAFGAWDAEAEGLSPNSGPRFRPALVMPHHPGVPFSTLSRQEQRRLLPLMIPALWDALCAARHGDLTASNIIIDQRQGRFVLIDPGVCLWSMMSGDEGLGWMDHFVAFTTAAHAYPLLPPTYHAPLEGRFGRCLDDHLKILRTTGFFMTGPVIGSAWFTSGRDSSVAQALVKASVGDHTEAPERRDAGPSRADLLAVGILYFQILTGNHPWPELAERPLWVGSFGEGRRNDWLARNLLNLNDRAIPSPGGASGAEHDLAQALLGLTIQDRADVVALAQRASGG